MKFTLPDLAALSDLPFDQVIDVRSPAEFAEDHIPGAINLPVLDNDERARVGTIYKQVSPFQAKKLGAALVAANAARHLQEYLADKPGDYRPLVYCWRGGQRSGSFAIILSQIGWRAGVIDGGYRTYRRMVVAAGYDAQFPAPVILLDGNTGTGKTDILNALPDHGLQVLDLEGMGNHRGSLLGARAGGQPAQKTFESRIAVAAAALDPAKPVVVEAESSKVGDCIIPPSLWHAMQGAPRIHITAPLDARAAYLTRAYADLVADRDALVARMAKLAPLHGHDQIGAWTALANAGAFTELAGQLMDRHYDPRYAKQRAGAAPMASIAADLTPGGIADAAAQVADAVRSLRPAGSPAR